MRNTRFRTEEAEKKGDGVTEGHEWIMCHCGCAIIASPPGQPLMLKLLLNSNPYQNLVLLPSISATLCALTKLFRNRC